MLKGTKIGTKNKLLNFLLEPSLNISLVHWKSPEGLDDVRGDGGSSLVGIGLPRQRHAVLGHVCDDGFVRGTW